MYPELTDAEANRVVASMRRYDHRRRIGCAQMSLAEPRAAFYDFHADLQSRPHAARVFDSLSAQTLGDFEWIVVDDGSTDGTADLVGRWMKSAISRCAIFARTMAASISRIIWRLSRRAANFSPARFRRRAGAGRAGKLARLWNTIPENCVPLFAALTGFAATKMERSSATDIRPIRSMRPGPENTSIGAR